MICFSDFFLFRNDHIWCDSCSEIVLFRNFHISCQIFSDSSCFRNRIWHDFLFLSSNSGNRSCVPFWSTAWKVAMHHLLAHRIVSKLSPDRILWAALDRFFSRSCAKAAAGDFLSSGLDFFLRLNFEKARTMSISNMEETMLLISYMYVIYIYIYIYMCVCVFLFTQFLLYSYLNIISSIILKL